MTLGQLRTFREVARTGSVTGAATALFVTPPSVSSVIAALQEELGVDLVERDGRGIRLTAAGEELARHAAEILGLVDRAAGAVREAAGRPGHLRLVAVTSAGEQVLPAVLARFLASHPVEVSLEVGNRATVFERLATRDADLGIAGRPGQADLAGEAFLDNDLVVVAHPGHPLAKRRQRVDPTKLSGETWLLREEGSGTRETTEQYLRDHDVEPARVQTIGSNGAITQAVAVGLGITLLSRQGVAPDLTAGRMAELPVRGTPLSRPWHVLWRRGATLTPSAQAFLDLLRAA